MTEFQVGFSDDNPFKKLQRPDGTASARAMLKTGCFHSRWEKFNAAILRAYDEFATEYGETAAQHEFHSTVKHVTRPMPRRGGVREEDVPDWDLTPVAQLYTCLKCDLPATNRWFVATGLEKLGFTPSAPVTEPVKLRSSATTRKSLTPFEVASYAVVGVGHIVGPDGTKYGDLNAKEAREGIEWLEGREISRAAAEADEKRMSLMPPPAEPMPNRYDARARMEFFNSKRGTWAQAVQAARDMLWNSEPPASLDLYMIVDAIEREMTVKGMHPERPLWVHVEFIYDRLRERINPVEGGWAPVE
jgi:hypothetical protein